MESSPESHEWFLAQDPLQEPGAPEEEGEEDAHAAVEVDVEAGGAGGGDGGGLGEDGVAGIGGEGRAMVRAMVEGGVGWSAPTLDITHQPFT